MVNPNMYGNYNPYQPPTLNGKLVDTIDAAKVADVPIGGYGVFPKADLSEIYIKSWNKYGQSNIITYKPTVQEAPSVTLPEVDTTDLEKRIKTLEEQLKKILKQGQEKGDKNNGDWANFNID